MKASIFRKETVRGRVKLLAGNGQDNGSCCFRAVKGSEFRVPKP